MIYLGDESQESEWGMRQKANNAIELVNDLSNQGSILLEIFWGNLYRMCFKIAHLKDVRLVGAFIHSILSCLPLLEGCCRWRWIPSPFQTSLTQELSKLLWLYKKSRDRGIEKCIAWTYGRTLSVCPEVFGTAVAGIRNGTTAYDKGTKSLCLRCQFTYKRFHYTDF